jgi:hypothetical protein
VEAVAVEPVIAAEADCSDRARAEAALASALSAARGPRRAKNGSGDARWMLRMSVAKVAPGIKAADAQIRDDNGHVVAERSVTDKTNGTCVPLVRAVSAWAQMVLDDELGRAQDEPRALEPEPEPARAGAPREDRPVDADAPTAGVAAPSPPKTGHEIEIGTMMFLRNGLSPGGAFGVSPFAAFAFGDSWVFRPSAAIGTALAWVPSDDMRGSLGGRLDVCRRVPGNYIDHRGIELDVCVGGDVNYVWSKNDRVRSSLGPSAILRGGIAAGFALELRTMAGVNLTRDDNLQPYVVACEVGGSVRFE